ncbi:hypothetical protein ACLOJK_004435 [Asimina triloba]
MAAAVMPLKGIVRDVRDGLGRSFSRRSFDFQGFSSRRFRSTSGIRFEFDAEEVDGGGSSGDQGFWASLPPELLRDVIKRLEASESTWPARRNVVACAAVCRSWRHMCKEIVGAPEISSKLTFPLSLKQIDRTMDGTAASSIQTFSECALQFNNLDSLAATVLDDGLYLN